MELQLLWLRARPRRSWALIGGAAAAGRLAARLQVHVGGAGHRAAAARVPAGGRGQRRPALDHHRAAHRPAVGAAEGGAGRLPGRVPGGQPRRCSRRTARAWGRSACRRCPYLLPLLAMWGLAILVVVVQKDLGAAFLFFGVFLALLYIATRRAVYVVRRAGPVPAGSGGRAVPALPARPAARGRLARPDGGPAGQRLPGAPGALRVRAGRHPGHGPGRRAADRGRLRWRSRRSTPTSRSRRWARSWAWPGPSRSAPCS